MEQIVRCHLDDLPLFELGEEAVVIRPEEADVGNLKEDHGQPLEAQAKRPSMPGV